MKAAKGGQVEFRAEKAGIIHAGIGKASFDEDKLLENARALADAIQRAKPAGAKGTYVQKVVAEFDNGTRACEWISAACPASRAAADKLAGASRTRRWLSATRPRPSRRGAMRRRGTYLSETARPLRGLMDLGPRAGDGRRLRSLG